MNDARRCDTAGPPGATATAGAEATVLSDHAPAGRWEPPDPAALSAALGEDVEVVRVLGRGGMGAVYEARQVTLDRPVAVKVLPPEVGRDPAAAARFLREARALAKLSHPNVVGVHDFGRTPETETDDGPVPGLLYIVMEYVDGADLRAALAAGIEPADALAVVRQMADALEYAHARGIVHRDIKPENVLLTRDGAVKIADFGLAKLADPDAAAGRAETAHTRAGQAMGTLHYMAPEQLRGADAVDHRADLYSFGVVLYELLTGSLPLGRFAPPSEKAGTDARLDAVVLRALETDPADRYQSAAEVRTDLDAAASESAGPPTPGDAAEPPGAVRFRVREHYSIGRILAAVPLLGVPLMRPPRAGVLRREADALHFEFPAGVLRTAVGMVMVPLADVRAAEFTEPWTGDPDLVLSGDRLGAFEGVPGAADGRAAVTIAKRDRAVAGELVADLVTVPPVPKRVSRPARIGFWLALATCVALVTGVAVWGVWMFRELAAATAEGRTPFVSERSLTGNPHIEPYVLFLLAGVVPAWLASLVAAAFGTAGLREVEAADGRVGGRGKALIGTLVLPMVTASAAFYGLVVLLNARPPAIEGLLPPGRGVGFATGTLCVAAVGLLLAADAATRAVIASRFRGLFPVPPRRGRSDALAACLLLVAGLALIAWDLRPADTGPVADWRVTDDLGLELTAAGWDRFAEDGRLTDRAAVEAAASDTYRRYHELLLERSERTAGTSDDGAMESKSLLVEPFPRRIERLEADLRRALDDLGDPPDDLGLVPHGLDWDVEIDWSDSDARLDLWHAFPMAPGSHPQSVRLTAYRDLGPDGPTGYACGLEMLRPPPEDGATAGEGAEDDDGMRLLAWAKGPQPHPLVARWWERDPIGEALAEPAPRTPLIAPKPDRRP